MNTAGKNAPATVISALLFLFGMLTAFLAQGTGFSLGYLLPGFIFLCAILTPIALLMAQQWEKSSHPALRGKLHRIAGPGMFLIIPFVDQVTTWVDQRICKSPDSTLNKH